MLVGAVILWNLSDSKNEKPAPASVMVTEEGRFPDFTKLLLLHLVDWKLGTRAKLELSYIEAALQTAYEETYLEMFKAHAALAREFKARSARTPEFDYVTSDA
jgi:hypothetical protein